MDESPIRLERDGQFATLTLNRPRYRNAINLAALQELEQAVDELADTPPRAVIFTGAEPGFCAGIDLKENRESTSEFAGKRVSVMHRTLKKLRQLPVPVVGAINGVAVGLGCELVISADIRVASPDARFAYLEPRVAVPSPAHHLVQLIGLARAQDLLLTARWVDADEGQRIGLFTTLADNPLDAAYEIAAQIAKLSPFSLAKTKENIWLSTESGSSEASEHHIRNVAAAADMDDRREALTAFEEKREPQFTGK